MKSILITGGAGFIGSKLSLALIERGASVTILDSLNPQVHTSDDISESLRGRVRFIKGDVRDRSDLIAALKGMDCVVHLAAETGTGQSMYEIERYFSVNVQGTANLLEILQNNLAECNIKKIVVASSRAVFGEGAYSCLTHGVVFPCSRSRVSMQSGKFELLCPICKKAIEVTPTPESAPFAPTSFYGLTKQVQEQAVLMYAKTNNINAFALRYQNVYGPGQSLKNPYTGILAVFSNLARQNKDINIFEDGHESRDFVYIDDVIEATIHSIYYFGEFIGPLNIGSGVAISVLEVANLIKKYFNSKSTINISGSFRMGDIRNNIADLSLMKQILGYKPRTNFISGLQYFLDWTNNQQLEESASYARSIAELETRGLMGESFIKN